MVNFKLALVLAFALQQAQTQSVQAGDVKVVIPNSDTSSSGVQGAPKPKKQNKEKFIADHDNEYNDQSSNTNAGDPDDPNAKPLTQREVEALYRSEIQDLQNRLQSKEEQIRKLEATLAEREEELKMRTKNTSLDFVLRFVMWTVGGFAIGSGITGLWFRKMLKPPPPTMPPVLMIVAGILFVALSSLL